MHYGIADGSYFALGAGSIGSNPFLHEIWRLRNGSAPYSLLSILSVSTLKTENKRYCILQILRLSVIGSSPIHEFHGRPIGRALKIML